MHRPGPPGSAQQRSTRLALHRGSGPQAQRHCTCGTCAQVQISALTTVGCCMACLQRTLGRLSARLAAVIARNVPSLRADALRSKSLIYQASSVPTPTHLRSVFEHLPRFCSETRTLHGYAHSSPPSAYAQARGTSPKKKPATRASFFSEGERPRGGARAFALPSIGRCLFRLRGL